MISSVAYAMKVIECLSHEAGGMLASELQRRSGVEKSVVSRIITTLQEEGYVRKDPKTELVRLTTRTLPSLCATWKVQGYSRRASPC